MKNYKNLVDYWKKANKKDDYQNFISGRDFLHENSKEIVEILSKNCKLQSNPIILEIGCGCGRNLKYIFDLFKDSTVHGNDLVKDECFKYMDKNLSDNIVFYEEDTLSFINSKCFHVDLFISSDHLMHIDPESAKEIISMIHCKWKPKYILTRETTRSRESGFKKWVHDFSVLEKKYEKVFESISKSNKSYPIVLWKLKKND